MAFYAIAPMGPVAGGHDRTSAAGVARLWLPLDPYRGVIRRAVAAFLEIGRGGVLGLLQELWSQCTEEPFPVAVQGPEG